jgi:hypothetical protein
MIYCGETSYFPYLLLLITTSDVQGWPWRQPAGKCQIIAQMSLSQTFAPDRMSLASRKWQRNWWSWAAGSIPVVWRVACISPAYRERCAVLIFLLPCVSHLALLSLGSGSWALHMDSILSKHVATSVQLPLPLLF